MLALPDDLFGASIFGDNQPDRGVEQRKKFHSNKKKHPNLKRKRERKRAKDSRRKNRRKSC